MFNRYPYTNFHELNLDYFIQHFNEIFTEWEQLYNELQSWKTDTTEELDQWRADVEEDLDDRESALRAELEIWKQDTADDISEWETATLNALNAWKTAATAQFEAIRVQAASSAEAAAASQTAAASAAAAALLSETAAEEAAAAIQAIAAQIQQNADDIDELKTQLKYIGLNLCGMDTTKYYPVYIPAGSSVTISTADGQPSEVAVPLYFYDANKVEVTWWPLPANQSKRTITVDSDVYFLKFLSVGAKNIMVSFGESAFLYTPYDKGYPYIISVVKNNVSDISALKEITESVHGDKITGWNDVGETTAQYVKTNGGIQNSDYCVLSDYFAVLPGDTVTYTNMYCNLGGVVMMVISCYDVDKTFISNAGVSGSTSGISGTYTIPDGCAYIRIGEMSYKVGSFEFYPALTQRDAIIKNQQDIDTLETLTESINGELINGWIDVGATSAKYITTTGTEQNSDYCALSTYIPVLPGDSITYNLNCDLGGVTIMAIACYDSSKTFIRDVGVSGSTSSVSGTYTFPDKCAYIRIGERSSKKGTFSFYPAATQKEAISELQKTAEELQSNIRGMKIAMIGDSTYAIAGGGSASNERVSDFLKEISFADISNFAIGGTTMAANRLSDTWHYYDFVELMTAKINNDMSEQLDSDNLSGKPGYIANVVAALNSADLSEYDILLINYGTNDFAAEYPLETPGTPYDTHSVLGALRTMVERIGTAYPNLHIVVNTPFWRCWNSPSDYVNDAFTKNIGTVENPVYLSTYVTGIKDVAQKEYGLPVIDNLFTSGWNRYTMNTYFDSTDGVHFNVAGAKYVARKTFEFLNQQGFALGSLS